jgi:hypothetical protein
MARRFGQPACQSQAIPNVLYAVMAVRRSEQRDELMPDTQELLRKIQALPPERVGEVENFVDFLAAKTRRLEALDRLLAVAPALEAAGALPLTDDDIPAEVDAVRNVRRTRGAGADRS